MSATKKKRDNFFDLFFLFLVGLSLYHLYQLNSLSLWGDELWNLSKMSLSYTQLLTPGSFDDPNYPTPIIFFKIFSSLFQSNNPSILVLANLVNLGFVCLGLYVLKKFLSINQIMLAIALLVANEYFLRIFFEIKSSGLVFGLSTLFSCFFLSFYLSKGGKHFLGSFLIGMLLSTIHPISGLFVCSSFLIMASFSSSKLERGILLLGIFFPIVFLFLYAFTQVNDFHIELNFKHIINTAGFVIPTILSAGLVIFFQFKKKFKNLKEIIHLMMPIIISLFIILAYSLFVMPIYQARYFMTFFPLMCLIIVLFSRDEIDLIKYPILIVSILSISLLYGPRSQIPYTNYKNLVEVSHSEECRNIPMFFNNSKTSIKKYYFETFSLASQIYSKKFQRKLIDYEELVSSFGEMSKTTKCKVIGVSGQGKQEVFIKELEKDLNIKNDRFKVNKAYPEGCEKAGCGLIWTIERP